MTVSNEDREAADGERLINEAIGFWWAQFKPQGHDQPVELAAFIRDYLVSHGWGPRPKVNGAALDHIADGFAEDGIHINLADLPAVLRECGVEVVRDGAE